MGCRPRAPSVLHCHGVLALRDRSLSEALLAVLEGMRLVSRQFRKRRLALWAAGRRARSVLHCHGVLALRDRSLSEALLAVLEGVRLVSRQFRKRCLALWAASRGPIRTSLPWCFGPARPVFERSFTGSAGRCETSF